MALEHLFDAELEHRPGVPPLVPDGDGILVGSGSGTVRGPSLNGQLVWTLFEQPGRLVCSMSPALRIETDDGAEILVDGRGFAARDRPEETLWRVAATLRFRTDDPGYAWLDGALGLWEGHFDAARGYARYRAYLQVDRAAKGPAMGTDGPTEALSAAGIPPARRGRERLRALSESERRLYGDLLRRFREGAHPDRGDVVEAAERAQLDGELTLQLLAREDLVLVDRGTGLVRVAYPFSGVPTAHRVRFPDGREVFAMCAIDALGMAPMFDEAIAIGSRDPLTGQEIEVALAPDGNASWHPDRTVVFSGVRADGNACAVLNFFASAANAERWRASQPDVRGTVISMPDAIAAGRTVFGFVLDGEEA